MKVLVGSVLSSKPLISSAPFSARYRDCWSGVYEPMSLLVRLSGHPPVDVSSPSVRRANGPIGAQFDELMNSRDIIAADRMWFTYAHSNRPSAPLTMVAARAGLSRS